MTEACEEIRLLIQADIDGELQPAEAARVAAHLHRCPACTEIQARLLSLSERVRQEAPSYPASEAFRAALVARIAAAAPKPAVARRRPAMLGASFGAGFAVAACLALLVLPQQRRSRIWPRSAFRWPAAGWTIWPAGRRRRWSIAMASTSSIYMSSVAPTPNARHRPPAHAMGIISSGGPETAWPIGPCRI
jgi:anti-sigma factor RsiW